MRFKKPKRNRRRSWSISKSLAVGLFLFIIVCTSALSFLNTSDNNVPQTLEFKAAIIDQLSLTQSNQTFVQTALSILDRAGFTVDYYRSEEVTVDFYRNLPTHGYGLIIFRVHSAAAAFEGKGYVEHPVSLFTSENYSNRKYVWEQLTDQISMASYTMPQPPYYFAITPKFVTSSMKGKFQNSIIVMMGCEGLNNTKMAEAFIEKGAKLYISWKGLVLASHTDQAITRLLQHFITDKQNIGQAVENTMKEVGPDPAHKSLLTYYPLEGQDYAI